MTDAIRERLRDEGMIGKEDHEFTRWVSAELTEAEKGDSRNYRPGNGGHGPVLPERARA